MNGKVKWFDAEKGYGFIEYEGEKDIFVHYSQIEQEGFKTLDENDLVTFDLVEEEKGLQAKHVVKITSTF